MLRTGRSRETRSEAIAIIQAELMVGLAQDGSDGYAEVGLNSTLLRR